MAGAINWGIALAVGSLIGARAAPGASKLWGDLDVRVGACSDETGFAPSEPGLAEDALAEGERA